MRHRDNRPVLWRELPGLTPYDEAMADMDRARDAVLAGDGREQAWLLESPEGFSRGGDVRSERAAEGLPIEGLGIRAHPGGWWYHGPGVLGIVLILDLRARRKSIPAFADATHAWIIGALRALGADAARREGCNGAWIADAKIATIALHLKRWVSSYGGAILVHPDLSRFATFDACAGNSPFGEFTSLAALGIPKSRADVSAALRASFHRVFGPTSA